MIPILMGSQLARFTMPPIIASGTMSSEDQRRFQRLTLLDPPKFSNVIGEDAYQFLMDYRKKFQILGSFELHEITSTTYQLRVGA